MPVIDSNGLKLDYELHGEATAPVVLLVMGLGMPAAIAPYHHLPHFQHLFAGNYAAGYYVYLWAEVLDADGFQAFVEAGDPFDAAVADRLLRFIYSRGDSLAPVEAYRAFRGRDASVAPLLAKRGLTEETQPA